MPSDAPPTTADLAAATSAADLLEQGWALHLVSVALCAGAATALLFGPGGRSTIGPAAVLFAGLAETWMALRVGFDAKCFRRIAAADDTGLADFDAALLRLGLMPRSKTGRSVGPRIEGARRLLALQGVATIVQAGLTVIAALLS